MPGSIANYLRYFGPLFLSFACQAAITAAGPGGKTAPPGNADISKLLKAAGDCLKTRVQAKPNDKFVGFVCDANNSPMLMPKICPGILQELPEQKAKRIAGCAKLVKPNKGKSIKEVLDALKLTSQPGDVLTRFIYGDEDIGDALDKAASGGGGSEGPPPTLPPVPPGDPDKLDEAKQLVGGDPKDDKKKEKGKKSKEKKDKKKKEKEKEEKKDEDPAAKEAKKAAKIEEAKQSLATKLQLISDLPDTTATDAEKDILRKIVTDDNQVDIAKIQNKELLEKLKKTKKAKKKDAKGKKDEKAPDKDADIPKDVNPPVGSDPKDNGSSPPVDGGNSDKDPIEEVKKDDNPGGTASSGATTSNGGLPDDSNPPNPNPSAGDTKPDNSAAGDKNKPTDGKDPPGKDIPKADCSNKYRIVAWVTGCR